MYGHRDQARFGHLYHLVLHQFLISPIHLGDGARIDFYKNVSVLKN